MQFAGGAALTNVNNARLRIDPIERLAQFITVALGAVQKHMHMRVPARHIRVPDVDLVKVLTSRPAQPCTQIGQEAV